MPPVFSDLQHAAADGSLKTARCRGRPSEAVKKCPTPNSQLPKKPEPFGSWELWSWDLTGFFHRLFRSALRFGSFVEARRAVTERGQSATSRSRRPAGSRRR